MCNITKLEKSNFNRMLKSMEKFIKKSLYLFLIALIFF